MFSQKFVAALLSCALLSSLLAARVAAQKKDSKSLNTPALPAPPPPTPYSDVRRDPLLNGFQVITLERQSDATVKCDIVVRAGSMFDLTGKTGLAALTQAALMAGNPRIREDLESLQAKIDWGVTPDVTWFRLESPPANFDTAMEIIARSLIAENVRTDGFQRAQQSQLENVKAQAAQMSAAARADEAFFKALYGDHPYGHNNDGDEKTSGGIKQGDALDFLKRFYLANDAFAVVTGPLKHERVLRTFKVFFGGWVKAQLTPATFRQPLRVAALNLVKIEAPDSQNVELRGGLLGVKQSDPDFLAVELLARILAARESSAPAFSVNAPARLLAGPFYFSAAAPAEQAQTLSRRLTDAVVGLAANAASAEELAAAKSALTAAYAARPIEQFLREIEIYNLPKTYPLTLNEKIEKLTAADLQRVAKRLLEANALTVVVLGRVNDTFKSE